MAGGIERTSWDEYLKSRKEAESWLLTGDEDVLCYDRPVYELGRSIVAEFAHPYIVQLLRNTQHPHILEVGCGTGEAIKKMLRDHKKLDPAGITGTSLSEFPEHHILRRRGVTIRTDIVVEQLPQDWEQAYDVVLASVVLQWAHVSFAIPEIERVLIPGGLFLGFDQRAIAGQVSAQAVTLGMTELCIENELFWEQRAHGLVPFALQK